MQKKTKKWQIDLIFINVRDVHQLLGDNCKYDC